MRATAVRSAEVTLPDGLDQLASSDRLMTAKEVARLLAISEKTIYGSTDLRLRVERPDPLLQDSIVGSFPGARCECLAESASVPDPLAAT